MPDAARGLAALLGEAITGIVISDRWWGYNRLPLEQRQVCWAHLKRDFQKCSERGGEGKVVGDVGLAVVEDIFTLWREYREGLIDRSALGTQLGPAIEELRAALEQGSCGVDRKVKAFCDNLLALEPALWLFAGIAGVEPTNNHAERVLRMGVLWRKNASRLSQRVGMPVCGEDTDGGPDPAIAETIGPRLLGRVDHRSSVGYALASISGAEVGLNGYVRKLKKPLDYA